MQLNDKRLEYARVEKQVLRRIKDVARLSGVRCEITSGELTIPEYCPVTGVRLEFNNVKSKNNFCVKRIDTSKGCEVGNIRIISKQAIKVLTKLEKKLAESIEREKQKHALRIDKVNALSKLKVNNRELYMHKLVIANAISHSVDCKLTVKDIIIPNVCPILGINLDGDFISRGDNTPHFELIDSNKGYIKGNFRIISHKAKKIKADMSRSSLNLTNVDVLTNMLNVAKFYSKV